MISALGLRWVWLLLFPSLSQQTSSGTFSVKVQSPVSGLLGSSVSLHCALTNNVDARTLGVRWYRPKMSNTPILFYKNTQIQKSPVDVQYEGRVFLIGELVKGDVSLRLENLTLADRGDYVCHVNSDNWYDKATVSLRVRAVGSTPVLSMNEAAGEMKFTCQSHGWLPEPSITWTDKDGRDLKHLSKDKFTNDSEGFVDVSSWLIVSPSESKWISCSVGFSDQERKESRIMPHTPTADTESWKVPFTVTLILLLLCISGSTVCLVQQRKALIDYRRNRTQAKETSRTASESKPMYNNCVEDGDKNEAPAPAADTDHHIVGRDLDQIKQFKVYITIDPDETPESLVHKEKEVKCSVANHSYDSNNYDEDKIFTLCKEKFTSGKHYWEVKVRESLTVQKLSWFVGVASDAAENMYNTPFTPQNEFWVLCYEKEKGLYIRDRAEPLPSDVTNKLTAVGVFLDCDKHTLSFYNINTKSHIYTFTNVEPKKPLRPLISPGVRDTYPVWIL